MGEDVKKPKRDLGNLSVDPTRAEDAEPESWEEQPVGDDGAGEYLLQRPPHHGD